ncbi:MAG: hypothetical protein HY854_19410 [Burkholderiales bacterium]|nr:hypothetical protein [Burkholderiales bacterium]
MSRPIPRRTALLSIAAAVLPGCGGGGGGGGTPEGPQLPIGPVAGPDGPAWPGFGRDAQHTALSAIATQDLNRITWSTPVDDAPQYTTSGTLLIHYGSPVISPHNTVVYPVRTPTDAFRIEARSGANGALWWSAMSDYVMPPHNWVPSFNMVLTTSGRLYAPGAGGKVLMRETVEGAAPPAFQPLVFFGAAAYNANPAAFNTTVFINTPIVADAAGNVFFGFQVTGTNPAGLEGGIARIGTDGQGRWVSAASASADPAMTKAAMNCAPALSPDGSIVYMAVNAPAVQGTVQRGYLLALDSATLTVLARVSLLDPATNTPARVSDNATSSPAVGPDGRVFYGVLESVSGAHNFRGWLLQFDPLLTPAGVPGGFGWDVTPTVIPAAMVPSYGGPSTYLLALKYNNYAPRGDGLNRLAVIDPRTSQADSIIPAVTIMREVLTILSPTADPDNPGGREEWCINTMAADPVRRSVLANNEDGVVYRWDLVTNTLVQPLRLNTGLGQAYTPTLVGTDGAVYAVSNATLFSIRAA